MTQQEFSMKSHIKTAVSGVFLPLLVMTFLTACSNVGLLASIEKEVKLKDPTMRGIVTSLEVVGGNIYVTNGILYKRTGGTGDWDKVSLPSGAARCSEIASDGTYLYARFTKDDLSVLHSVARYEPASGGWTSLTGVDNIALIGSGSGRIYVFTGSEDKYNAYELTSGNTAVTATPILTDINTPTGTVGNYIATNKKVYTNAGAELGSSPSGVTGITMKGTNVYAVNASYVWRYAAGSWTSIKHSFTTPTTNISYLGAGGKNLLLIGSGSTAGGYGEVRLDGTDALSSVINNPGDSSDSSITVDASIQYNNSIGLWNVHGIYAVTTAVPSGDSYVLYACVVEPTYGGLWSYYSDSRNEWNRE
jgi:hypothetical protein